MAVCALGVLDERVLYNVNMPVFVTLRPESERVVLKLDSGPPGRVVGERTPLRRPRCRELYLLCTVSCVVLACGVRFVACLDGREKERCYSCRVLLQLPAARGLARRAPLCMLVTVGRGVPVMLPVGM